MKSDEGTDTDLIWPKYIIFAGFILNESYILQPADAVWHWLKQGKVISMRFWQAPSFWIVDFAVIFGAGVAQLFGNGF